jgi:hypothetical protein
MTPIEEQARKVGILIRAILYLIVGVVVLPFAIMAIKGWLAIAAVFLIAGATVAVAPALQMAAQNWRLKLLKGQAARNPVESMQVIYMQKMKDLNERAESIQNLRIKRVAFLRKLDDLKKKFPDDAANLSHYADRLTDLLNNRAQRYTEAQKAVAYYNSEIERTQAIWEAGKAAKDALQGEEYSEDQFLSDIKTKTSIDAAQDQLESAFAALDQSLLEDSMPSGNRLTPAAKEAFQKTIT